MRLGERDEGAPGSTAEAAPGGSARLAPLWGSLSRGPYAGPLAFLALAAIGALARAGYWKRGVEYDASQYLYIGQVVLDGGTPYEDAANNKGPALFLLFAVIRLVAGTSPVAVRLLALLLIALAALALAAYVASYAGRGWGLLAGALLAAITASPELNGTDLYAEQFGLAPMMGALWLAARGGRPSMAGAGALTAFAALMHPAFALVAPFVIVELWRASGAGRRARGFGAAALGALAVAAPILGWIAVTGAFDDMLIQSLGQIGDAVRDPGAPADGGPPIGGVVLGIATPDLLDFPLQGLTALALLGGAIAAREARYRALAAGVIVWIVASWARAELSSYEFTHHYVLAAPAIATGLTLGLDSVWRLRLRGGRLYRLAFALPALVLVFFAVIRPGVGSGLPDNPLGGPDYTNGDPQYAAEAEFLRANTAPDDTVLSIHPEVLWRADRRAPTRFFDFYEVLNRPEYQREREQGTLANPPDALVLQVGVLGGTGYLELLNDRQEYNFAYETPTSVILLRAE